VEERECQGCSKDGKEVFWLRVYYSMTNPVKEPILEQLVQFLGINIKMDGKSRPFRPSVPISPASVIYAMASPTE
jgi:hypothetical protein